VKKKTNEEYSAELRDFPEAEARKFFAELFHGDHHIPSKLHRFGYGWKISVPGGMFATFDNYLLTKLVLLAHDRMMRIELIASGPRMIGMAIHKRGGRRGPFWYRHSSIEEAIKRHRENHAKPKK
jgi:hypothetical protein